MGDERPFVQVDTIECSVMGISPKTRAEQPVHHGGRYVE
jgi:hypothetical protein